MPAQSLAPVHISGPRGAPPWFRGAMATAGALYCLLALLVVAADPGLHYDEALMVHGAVHLLHGAQQPPPFAHGPGYWVEFGGRHWPLMVIPYIGAARHYLSAPLFALLGPTPAVIRLSSAALTLCGLWGLAWFAGSRIGWHESALATALLALSPSFVLHTVLDASGLALWFASLGLLAAALGALLSRPSGWRAFGVGLAAGFAVWCRLNVLWLLLATVLAALLLAARDLWALRRHLPAAALGAVLGLAPVAIYQLLSRFETFDFMRSWTEERALSALLLPRLGQVAETLVLDEESRGIWNGAATPTWQLALVSALAIAAWLWALVMPPGERVAGSFRRGVATALALYLGLLLSTRMLLKSHHLVTALPLVALLLAAAAVALWRRGGARRVAAAGALLFWLGSLLAADGRALSGLRRTGGLWAWNDGLEALHHELALHHSGERAHLLDWGFANGLYVLAAGAFDFRELFWGATESGVADGRSWEEVVAGGGLFLSAGSRERAVPPSAAATGFERALAASGQRATRQEVRGRSGQLRAEVVVVAPAVSGAP